MLAIARWRGLAWPTPQQWAHSGLIGTLMVLAAMALVVLAQKMGIGSGLMATVVTSMPMWLALWARWGGEPVPAMAAGVQWLVGSAVGMAVGWLAMPLILCALALILYGEAVLRVLNRVPDLRPPRRQGP